MLEAVILLQLLLGKWSEAAVVAALLLFNAALGLFQESRAQVMLTALRSRLALVANVRRDGAWTTAATSRLVAADVVELSLGGDGAAGWTAFSLGSEPMPPQARQPG